MTDLILGQDAFIRKIGLNKDIKHGFFLGAGASISSGIPSAESCIWEWKRSIFLSNNAGLEPQFSELTLNSTRDKIQRWLDNQAHYPKLGEVSEYSFYIEKCYDTHEDRRKFFDSKIRSAKPYIGYKLLCLWAEAQLSDTIFTTNFDNLVIRTASNFELTPIEIGIDSQSRISRHISPGELMCISLHGDYRYDNLKNTDLELQNQEKVFIDYLIEFTKDYSLIVSGYSGRDKSIMECLVKAYSEVGTGSIYWCGYGDEIPSNIESLLLLARKNNRLAFFVPTNGFDDLMKKLALYCLEGATAEKARSIISQEELSVTLPRLPFQISDELPVQTMIKSNSFELECPINVFQFDLINWPESEAWKWVEKISLNKQFVAVPFRGKILAVGDIAEITETFGDNLKGPIERTPIDQKELYYEDGVVNALFRRALVKLIANSAQLNSDHKEQIWNKSAQKQFTENIYKCNIFDSAILYIRKIGDKVYLIIKPSLRVENAGKPDEELPQEIVNKIKNSLLGYQHNREFNHAVNNWRQKITGFQDTTKETIRVWELGKDETSKFTFKLRRSPVFAVVRSQSQSTSIKIKDAMQPLIKQNGIRLTEPKLLFSNKQGNNYVLDEHPLRGLVSNRPYDYPITQNGLLSSIKIGVICPKTESQLLDEYLLQAQSRHSPAESEKDYLIDYPGFSSAFGLPIQIPRSGNSGWIVCPEPTKANYQESTIELSRSITQAINELDSSSKPNVIIIFVPNRWKNFRNFETENENFDLHDYIKAYCAQRGIASQFLEQETIADKYQARIWLSLALYAKSMRTPWVLNTLDSETAFVGLGFSINQKAIHGRHVVLGCSHLYNARGEGLQFRLSSIENPIIVRSNAFMSREDARNVGETIRTLFFESSNKLPRRVVIHKQTAFRKDERDGLRDGLTGVEEIDMLEINFDSALRYVASIQKQDGKFDEDNYPIRRGTVVQLDSYSSLIWVHGVTDAVTRGLKYYKGKRRIPTPLIVRRHVGSSNITQIATEILALSKMDWNSADMYSKLPATIQSSQKIARIGSLLQRFGPMSYDYRLFI